MDSVGRRLIMRKIVSIKNKVKLQFSSYIQTVHVQCEIVHAMRQLHTTIDQTSFLSVCVSPFLEKYAISEMKNVLILRCLHESTMNVVRAGDIKDKLF